MSYRYECPVCGDFHGTEYKTFVYPESKVCDKCNDRCKMKYYYRNVYSGPVELTEKDFWNEVYTQFIFDDKDKLDTLLKSGHELVGPTHIYWIEGVFS